LALLSNTTLANPNPNPKPNPTLPYPTLPYLNPDVERSYNEGGTLK